MSEGRRLAFEQFPRNVAPLSGADSAGALSLPIVRNDCGLWTLDFGLSFQFRVRKTLP